MSLSWKAPASDGGAQITGYDVYEGTASTITGKPVASATGTSATVKNLANGTTYYFKVTAVNKAGQGAGSGVASATPAAPVTNPSAPAGLTATPGHGRVTLSWTAPASDGGAGIAGYEVYQGTSPGGESKSPVNGALVTATGYTVTGLTNGTTYYFTVAAVNQAKRQGNKSGEASAAPALGSASALASASASVSASQTAGGPASGTPGGAGTPGAPGGLTATPGNGQVSLSWTAPAGTASAPARYDVYEGTSPGFPLGTPVRSTTGTSTTVTGLKNGTRYYFVVTALDVKGTVSGSSGEASAEPTAVLTSDTVPTPVIVALAAVAVVAVAAALALAVRRLRGGPPRHARKRPPPAPPSDVRAVPEPGRPGPVSIHEMHEIGVDETYTVRLEPLPAEVITILEEIGS